MEPLASRVLIVDDSQTMLSLLEKELKALGYTQIEKAANGEKAVEMVLWRESLGSRYDLIISDLKMPVSDGMALLNFVRKTSAHPDTPVVIVTSEGERRTVIEAIGAGADSYIVKPFSRQTVSQALKRLAERKTSPAAA